MKKELIRKYNVPSLHRYTSYPTVPYWDENSFSDKAWKSCLISTYKETNEKEGISLYIHLPYCESLCTYCGCNTRITVNHAVEGPYIQRILKEWQLYKNLLGSTPIIKEIHLGGGTPTFFSAENIEILIKGLLKEAKLHFEPEMSFEAHPANTTEQHLKTLYNLGFRRLSLGVQDFDEKVQQAIHRIQSYDQVKDITSMARQIGYSSINFDLIYGLPFQTRNSIETTITLVNTLKPERIAFYSYAHVPWIKPGQRGYEDKDLPTNEEKLELYKLGKSMFENSGYSDIGMDHFALPEDELFKASLNGNLHRNFMGYTSAATKVLIGLGVSSISDSWTAFAQNVKTVERYNELIDANQIPVFRGHILTEEDKILRQHILDIMCNFKTNWSGVVSKDEIERILQPMISDELIVLKHDGLEVSEIGKSFVRNVCMAFDKRLREKQPDKQVFSSTI